MKLKTLVCLSLITLVASCRYKEAAGCQPLRVGLAVTGAPHYGMAQGLPSPGPINKLTFKLGPMQSSEDEQKKAATAIGVATD